MTPPIAKADVVLASNTALRALSRVGVWMADEHPLPGPPWPLNAFLLALMGIGPLLLGALVIQEVTPFFWFLLIADLVLLFAVASATFRTPALFIGVIIIWFALQRIVVALLAPDISADLVRLLLTYKEGFYLILVTVGAITVAVRHLRGERAIPALFAADVVAIAFLGLPLRCSSTPAAGYLSLGRSRWWTVCECSLRLRLA